MKKIFISFLLITSISVSAFSQNATIEEKSVKALEELKAALSSKLALPAETLDKIVMIETEFHNTINTIEQDKSLTQKEKDVKRNAAHVTHRANLTKIPLSSRQMETVIDTDRVIRGKYKL